MAANRLLPRLDVEGDRLLELLHRDEEPAGNAAIERWTTPAGEYAGEDEDAGGGGKADEEDVDGEPGLVSVARAPP
jgi:hypothetical protein